MNVAGCKVRAAEPARLRMLCMNIAQGLATLLRAPRLGPVPAWRTRARIISGTLAAIILIACAMIWLDARAIEAARTLPRWITDTFEQITDFGLSGWFLTPTGLLLLTIAAVASPALPRFAQLVLATIAVRVGFIFLAIGVPGLFVTVVKRLIGRARPFVGGEADPYLYGLFVWRPDYASLPSGHATTAFSALVAIGALWPRLRPLMWAYALVIALSRVVVLAHHPSDVLAGAFVGGAGAWLVRDWFAARRLGFVISADGQVHALPGPPFRRIKRVARQVAAS